MASTVALPPETDPYWMIVYRKMGALPPGVIAKTDFNGDGYTDLLWRNTAWGEAGIWFMDGTTQIGGESLGNVDLIWELVGTGDFNVDGKVDLLWRNTAWGEVGVWYMDGTAHVGDASIGVVDLIWRLVKI